MVAGLLFFKSSNNLIHDFFLYDISLSLILKIGNTPTEDVGPRNDVGLANN